MRTFTPDKLALILDAMPARVAYVDSKRRYLYGNRAYREWHGINENPIRGKHVASVIGADSYAKIQPHLNRVFAGESARFELTTQHPTQGRREADVTLIPDTSRSGEVVGYFVFSVDVTDRNDAKRAESFLAAALNNVSDGVSLYDSSDRLVMTNAHRRGHVHQIRDVMQPGTHFEEIVRRFADKYVAREGTPEFDAYLEERKSRRSDPKGPFEVNFNDRWIMLRDYPTDDGGTLSLHTDITEIKRRELDLAQIEERYELASRSAGVGVWDWNFETGEFYVDPNLMALIGYREDEIETRSDVWLSLVHPDDRDRTAEAAQAHVRGETPEFISEHRKLHKDGSDRWFLARGRVVESSGGKPVRMIGTDVDITDLKRTQLALEESEQRYRTLVEICPDVVIVHRDGKFIYANPAAVSFYGAKDASELIGRESIDFIHPDDRPIVLKRRAGRQTPGVVSDFYLLRFILDDGTRKSGEGCVGTLYWDGELATMAIVRETTERDRITQALRESEERYRTLMDLLPDAVLVTNGQDVLFANNGAAGLLGAATADDLVGRKFLDLVHPDDREDALQRRVDMLRSGKSVGTVEHRHLRVDDGTPVNVEKAACRIVWQGEPAILGVFRDLTDRRRMEAALRESEGFLRLITNNVAALISYIGPDGRYRFVNRKYEEWFGLESKDIVGNVCWDFVAEHIGGDDPDDVREKMRTNVLRALSGEPAVYEAARVYSDGTRRHIRNTLVPQFTNGGRPTGVCALVYDVTLQKEREEQLRSARDAAERANESKSRFLAAASHDLRQPLQALNLFTFALAESAAASGEGELIRDMRHALGAMEGVLNGLIDISKLDAGVVTPEFSNVPLAEMLDQLRGAFAMQAKERGLEFRVVPSSLVARTDPDLLSRILDNLISNAIRYTPSGRILLGCRRRGSNVSVEVWDTGTGIPSDQIEHVFEEFYQLDNPARDRDKGMGLGLAIVDRTARLLEHTVEVRSKPGHGSMFAVYLPMETEAPVSDFVAAGESTRCDLTGNRILVIEDDKTVLGATRTLLERWGAGVASANTTDEALERIAEEDFRPDLVIADYSLPHHETGTQAIECLRGALGYPVSGIIITGDTAPARVKEAQNAGFQVLHKPVDAASLRDLIGTLVNADGVG